MDFCLHEGGHSGNEKKAGAPWVRLDHDNGSILGLAIAYTIANADRELPGTVTKFMRCSTRVSLPGSVNN